MNYIVGPEKAKASVSELCLPSNSSTIKLLKIVVGTLALASFSLVLPYIILQLRQIETHETVVVKNYQPGNDFLLNLSQALFESFNTSSRPKVLPFVVRNMSLYCTLRLREVLYKDDWKPHTRSRAVVEMIRTGLNQDQSNHHDDEVSFLPILFIVGDNNGCEEGVDQISYPRLSWSLPASNYITSDYFESKWCNAIGMPSYEMWQSKQKSSFWNDRFIIYSKEYPWTSKINKAVWRGSTTYAPRFKGLELKETPRGKLVRLSMNYPELIDAAFVHVCQQYKNQKDLLANETIFAHKMPFNDQMKYKAILDIDGNNWSSRFPKLLCTNSIVIKVCVSRPATVFIASSN